MADPIVGQLLVHLLYLVTWYGRQCYCQVYNSCSKCPPFARIHALRPVNCVISEWRCSPCHTKRPTNASSVRQCCAAANYALVAGCHHISHAGTAVPECYKDDVESQWKSLKFDPRHPKMPEPMTTKIDRGDYIPDIYPCAKLNYGPIGGFCPPHIRSCLPNVHSASFLGFFQLATA